MSDNSQNAGSNSRRKSEQVPSESVDALSREYFSNPEVFADAFNYLLYDGKPVITPDSLTPMDPNEMLLPSHLRLVGKAFERRRDLVKQFACKRGGRGKLCNPWHRGTDNSRLGNACKVDDV